MGKSYHSIVNKNNSWKELYERQVRKFKTEFWLTNLISEEFSEVLGGCEINFNEPDNELLKNILENNNLKDLISRLVKNTCLTSQSAIYFFKIDNNIYLDVAESIFTYETIGDNLISVMLITNIIKGTAPILEILSFVNNKVEKIFYKSIRRENQDGYDFIAPQKNDINLLYKYNSIIPCEIWFWNSDRTDMFLKIPQELFNNCNNILYQMNEDIFYSSSKLYTNDTVQINGRTADELVDRFKFNKVIPLDKPVMMGNNPYNYVIGTFQANELANALNYTMTLIRSICKANKPLSASGTHNKHTAEVLMENITYYNNIINQKNRIENLLNKLFRKIYASFSNQPFEGLKLEFNPIFKTQIEGIGNTTTKNNGT